MKKNRIIIILTSVFIIGCICLSCVFYSTTKTKALPRTSLKANNVIDINDPKAIAGFVDYVFVGRVDKISGTIYESFNDSAPELENSSLPFTEYEVQILDSLKGNLEVGSIVPVLKLGGISKDNQEIILLSEDDSLLSEGDVVIFFVSVQKDGSLIVSGENCSLIISDSIDSNHAKKAPTKDRNEIDISRIRDLPIYQEIAQACEDEYKYDRERYTIREEILNDAKD